MTLVALGVLAGRCQRRGDPGFLDCFPLRNLVVAMTRKLQPTITLNAVKNFGNPIHNTFAKVSEGEGEMGFRVHLAHLWFPVPFGGGLAGPAPSG